MILTLCVLGYSGAQDGKRISNVHVRGYLEGDPKPVLWGVMSRDQWKRLAGREGPTQVFIGEPHPIALHQLEAGMTP